MDDEQLNELECHLAAGTPLPEAFAAVQRDSQPNESHPIIWATALIFGLVVTLLLWWFK